jgi:hypothetical protein
MNSIQHIFDTVIDFLISRPVKKYQYANWAWLGGLYIFGLALWKIFLNCPDAVCTYNDWGDIIIPRLFFLKDVATKGLLPLHSLNGLMVGDFMTNRYMAIPDAFLSPQFLLLRFLSIDQFVYFQICLFFSLGFAGLLWFRRKFQLSIIAFTFLAILFNLNGHILANFSIGHLTWVGYFLFPWFAAFVFELIDKETDGWMWAAKTSLLLFATLLQGSYHHFIWMLLFIGLLAIFVPRHFLTLTKTAVLSVLLGMVRFLPMFSIIGTLQGNKFLAGYPDLQSILTNLIIIMQGGIKAPINDMTIPIGLWETTLYIGVAGAAFLIYFGLFRPAFTSAVDKPYRILLFPTLGLLFLSMDRPYRFVLSILPLPLFTGERVTTRFVSLVLVFVLFLAVIEFQKWLELLPTPKYAIMTIAAAGIFGVNDLTQNFREWSVQVEVHKFSRKEIINPEWFVANNYGDTQYINLIWVGLLITVVSLIFILVMVIKERRHRLSALKE